MNNEEIIKQISVLMDLMRKNGINKEILEETIKIMLPIYVNHNIKCKFSEKKSSAIYFHLPDEVIHLSISNIDIWVRKYIDKMMLRYPNCNFEELYSYVIIYLLNHEIEHAHQYLIGKNIINVPYQIIVNCYKQLFDLALNSNIKNTIQKLLYWLDLKLYNGVLERNANLEAFDTLYQLANYENNPNMINMAHQEKKRIIRAGYDELYNGAVERTYKNVLIFNKPIKSEGISIEDRVRYGLPIDEYTKKKVLNYEFEA